ncbi:MAG: NAD-dependent protein deacetylase [Myxococcota bacterium]
MAQAAAVSTIDREITELVDLLRGRRAVALTGAGCSTESGIPDYRGPETARKARNPIRFRTFLSDPSAHQRYWARSVLGWPKIAQAEPNPTHTALAEAEREGVIVGVITQNVDRLHHRAGSRRVVELHGALADVRCLTCGAITHREELQNRMLRDNPGWFERGAREIAPDGDAVPSASTGAFVVPHCLICGGNLKPDVVFFGENVAKATVDAAWRLYRDADVLLVIGSSLTVFSGYRFVRRAAKDGKLVAIINLGPTRGDSLAALRLDANSAHAVPALVRQLAT